MDLADAARFVAVFASLLASYYAVRLTIVYRWKRRDPRSHVRTHVFWLTLSLAMTAILISIRLINRLGSGEALVPWDAALNFQTWAMVLGLRPMWVMHRRREARRTRLAKTPPVA